MTIDEAIRFCEEKSENIKLKAESQVFIQLAEWLKDLKRLKNEMFSATAQIQDLMSAEADKTLQAHKCGYNKAIYNFADKIVKLSDDEKFMSRFNKFPATTILEVAEELTVGE